MGVKELFDLSNKTAIVTGGGSGLGQQMAEALAEAGANIVICSRNLEVCKATSNALNKQGYHSIALQCDVTKQEDIDHVIEQTVNKFGSIDILINNSGTSWIAPVLDLPAEKWDKVMDVNLKGMFFFSQAAAKVMKNQQSGKIINISSVTGLYGTNPAFLDSIAYNTSKGAVITLTKELAVKLADSNIQVNAIAPGFFPTKITQALDKINKIILSKIPAQRFGNDTDLKGTALFLASHASDYLTGQCLIVDGGLTVNL
ncbi:SDR family oxidoreductase [Heyndrickxia oleronia]|uniref:SDR family oxidoreductase n=1 Tax=Heyndrickxia oleronia TaxID=38875 RepID=UPI00203AB9BC|nr:SDR family oxidoreductase [Heyndrickxia oleronia]MCM3238910.1 SDR family oxidoreductase [Heyndrickxia oleronia]